MKGWIALFAVLVCVSSSAETWQPPAGLTQIAIWPGTPPNNDRFPGAEVQRASQGTVGGRHWLAVENVSKPTMTVYAPKGNNTGAAVVVLPGGGFQILAMDLEGSEVCDWLTSKGITCVLLKYRVPSVPYVWRCDCRPDNLMIPKPSLQDVQRTLGLVRFYAKDWHIDPHKVGVIGFSAGGYLVASISTNYRQRLYAPVDAADSESARPDFAMPIYPGHLATGDGKLNPNVPVTPETPPTFLIQAGNDHIDSVEDSLVYYTALQKAGVPVEMHLYAKGGHAFGLRQTAEPITGWPHLAEQWLHSIGVLSASAR